MGYRLTIDEIIQSMRNDIHFNSCMVQVKLGIDYEKIHLLDRIDIRNVLNDLEFAIDMREEHFSSDMDCYRCLYKTLKWKEQLFFEDLKE